MNETPALFCTLCFASDTDGSWNHVVLDANYCTNCGAGGAAIQIPRWAVEQIRKNASWVGKRYYPNDEDKERGTELAALRRTIKVFPGRTADELEEGKWRVSQKLTDKRSVSIYVDAATKEEALGKAVESLPYVEDA